MSRRISLRWSMRPVKARYHAAGAIPLRIPRRMPADCAYLAVQENPKQGLNPKTSSKSFSRSSLPSKDIGRDLGLRVTREIIQNRYSIVQVDGRLTGRIHNTESPVFYQRSDPICDPMKLSNCSGVRLRKRSVNRRADSVDLTLRPLQHRGLYSC